MSGPSQRGPVVGHRFFAVALMAVGLLMVALCSLCTFKFWLVPGGSNGLYPGLVFGIILMAVFGGVPNAIGATIFVVGLRLYRQP